MSNVEVWVLDDEVVRFRALKAEARATDAAVNLRHFKTPMAFVRALLIALCNGQPLPEVIVFDNDLQDTGRLEGRDVADVLAALYRSHKAFSHVALPAIMAWSQNYDGRSAILGAFQGFDPPPQMWSYPYGPTAIHRVLAIASSLRQ